MQKYGFPPAEVYCLNIDELNESNALERRIRRPAHDVRLFPLRERRFFHELILQEVSDKPSTEKSLATKFPEYSYAIREVLDREVKKGSMKACTKAGKTYYEITDKGTDILQLRPGRKLMCLSRQT